MSQIDDTLIATLSNNNIPRAIALARSAFSAGVESAIVLNLLAYQLELEGSYAEALSMLERALSVAPDDPLILGSLGDCLSKSGRPGDALRAFDAAIAIHPGFARGHHGRGLALAALGDRPAAVSAHQRASSLDENYADPFGALAALAFESGEIEEAGHHASRALALDDNQPAAHLTLAMIQMRIGDHQGTVDGMSALLRRGSLSLLHEASAQRLCADALELLDRPGEAFEAYRVANAALAQVYVAGARAAGLELGVELCARLKTYFQERAASAWSKPDMNEATEEGAAVHVFLMGFPRSGTTLLEQVLASHPDIVALEERPTLDPILNEYFEDATALERLMNLAGEEANRQRRDYWRRVKDFDVLVEGKVFVDKIPLNTIYIPLIAKLFPNAKIIFAIRDPRDVVLSCFQQRFQPNSLVIEYTNIVRAARFYAGVMELAEIYKDWIPIDWYNHHHENLVQNFDEETKFLCDFLGLTWRSNMRDFVSTAETRDIRTPSAAQVRKGLNRQGVGRWRRHRRSLESILPTLHPWVQKFGYSID